MSVTQCGKYAVPAVLANYLLLLLPLLQKGAGNYSENYNWVVDYV